MLEYIDDFTIQFLLLIFYFVLVFSVLFVLGEPIKWFFIELLTLGKRRNDKIN